MTIIAMKWILYNQNCSKDTAEGVIEDTVEDTQSGFAITLLAGSWIEPFDLDTKIPEGMSFKGHALYLRSGLGFAKKCVTNRLA
jgi:hypothetical protein